MVAACEPLRQMADELGIRLGDCIITKGVPALVAKYRELKDERYASLTEADARAEWLTEKLNEAIEIAHKVAYHDSPNLWEELDQLEGMLSAPNSLQPNPLTSSPPAPVNE